MAIRTSSLLLAVLLSLTPVTQVLAQAEQQGQQSQASQTESNENSEPGVSQGEEREAALPNSRVAEADTVQLLRLEATVFFPKTDSPPLYGSAAAATPAAAATSTLDTVLFVVIVVGVLALFALGTCWKDLCGV
jgi:uncharacterized membrane protein YdbT with pleckstrin-like domain